MLPVWLTDTVTTDLRGAMRYTLLWGLEGIVLRTMGKDAQRVPRVNEAQVREQLEINDVLLSAIDPGLFECSLDDRVLWMNELATFDETLGFCRRVGTPRVIISGFTSGVSDETRSSAVEALRQAGERAAKHGVRLLVRNRHDHAHATARDVVRLLGLVDHPSLGLAWDPAEEAHAESAGSVDLGQVVPHLGLVFCGNLQRAPEERAVNWEALIEQLYEEEFRGPVCLKMGPDAGPREALRAATDLIRALRAARRMGTAGPSSP